MEWQLYRAIIASTFGRGSAKPFRTALIRLACLFVGSTVLGMILSDALASLSQSKTGSQLHLILMLTTATQACVLFVLLAASGALQDGRSLGRLLLFWPLPTTVRWKVLSIPSVILALFAIALTAPSLIIVASRAGLPVVFIALCCSAGFFMAMMAYQSTTLLHGLRLPAIFTVVATQYWLAYISGSAPFAAATGYGVLLLALGLSAYVARKHLEDSLLAEYGRIHRPVALGALPVAWWFLKKAVRNRQLQTTFATNLALSTAICVLLTRIPGGTIAAPFCASLLTATFVSDFRCLARKSRPPEITALRGTAHFLVAEASTASILALVVAAPLLAVMQPSPPNLAQLAACIGAGLFAGSFIVPAPRDITGQGAATLLCVTVLALPIQFSGVIDPAREVLLLTFLASVLLIASYAIEHKRNPYNWRNHANKKTRTTN